MVGIRTIINADQLKEVIDMPEELKGKEVELIVLPLINAEKDSAVEKDETLMSNELTNEHENRRFSDEKKLQRLFLSPIKVEKIIMPSRDELHER